MAHTLTVMEPIWICTWWRETVSWRSKQHSTTDFNGKTGSLCFAKMEVLRCCCLLPVRKWARLLSGIIRGFTADNLTRIKEIFILFGAHSRLRVRVHFLVIPSLSFLWSEMSAVINQFLVPSPSIIFQRWRAHFVKTSKHQHMTSILTQQGVPGLNFEVCD